MRLTGRTQTKKGDVQAVNLETGTGLELFVERFEQIVADFASSTATAADQVVMMLPRTLSLQVAAAGVAYVYLAEQAVFLKQFESAVYRHQTYIGISLMQPVMDISRSQVLTAVAQHGNNGLPLRCKLESPLPQLCRNILSYHVFIVN